MSLKLFNGDPFVVLTHSDMDGVGCAILLTNTYKKQVVKILNTGYNSIHQKIHNASLHNCKNIIVTDLSLEDIHIKSLEVYFDNVIFIDHHETSKDIRYPLDWKVFINTKACATKLVQVFLTHKGHDLKSSKEFVNLVNDYDIWLHQDSDSILLNNIYWELKFNKFLKSFLTYTFPPDLYRKARQIQKVKEEDIVEFDSYIIEDDLMVIVADKHISDISLFYREQKHFFIINKKGRLSLRSTKNMLPFYEQLKSINISCGGHKNAGGVELKGTKYETDNMEIIEMFYNFVKG